MIQETAKQVAVAVVGAFAPHMHLENGMQFESIIVDTNEVADWEGNPMKRLRERVDVGIDENGNPMQKWATGSTRKELHDSIVRLYIEHGLIGNLALDVQPSEPSKEAKAEADTKRIRFKEYVESWMMMYKIPKLRGTTIRGYKTMLKNHLYPAFGLRYINDLTTDDLQTFLNARKQLARKTLKEILTFLSQVFEAAIEDGIIDKNPVKSKKLTIPTDKKTERDALLIDDFMDVLANLDSLDIQDGRLVALLMFTGMRRGEALGLCWDDIDFTQKTIQITRNVTYAENQPHIGDPKTYAGKRVIPLLPVLEALLNYSGEKGYIVGGDSPLSHTMYVRTWNRIKRTIDMHGASAHIFRHTFLTFLSNAGVSPKIIQVIAGHADISTTMNIYTHGHLDEILKAGSLVSALFKDNDKKDGDDGEDDGEN